MISIISPYPEKNEKTDGYWSRVLAVDEILKESKRVYINIQKKPLKNDAQWKDLDKFSKQLNIYSDSVQDRILLEEVLLNSTSIYIHSLYQAQFVLPFIKHKKTYVDYHGVVPEENLIYQNKYSFKNWEKIERYVCENAHGHIFVTEKMKNHFKNKYSKINLEKCFVLPIVNDLNVDTNIEKKENNIFLYSGGNQPWQNLDKIISFIQSHASNENKFLILSPDCEAIKAQYNHRLAGANCEFLYVKDTQELYQHYKKAKYGFIIRDNNVVNQVACPTKIIEYLNFQIIPIVDFADIGDFKNLGYKYIKYDNFKNPDSDAQCNESINTNLEVCKKMKTLFRENSLFLKKELLSTSVNNESSSSCYDLSDYKIDFITSYYSQLYFDFGTGFSEFESIKIPLDLSKDKIEFSLDSLDLSKLVKVRLDPMNFPGEVELVQAFLIYNQVQVPLTFKSSNGRKLFNKIKFKTDDPNIVYIFDNLKNNIKETKDVKFVFKINITKTNF